MARRHSFLLACILGIALVVCLTGPPLLAADGDSILNKLKSISTLSTTKPANGDVNPYGLVRVPHSMGNLHEGSYLVSNFNDSDNFQGTGTTIVEISPEGSLSLFSQIDPTKLPGPCPGGVGLTTALAVLRTGWVIVGSLPTADSGMTITGPGCLIVLNSEGTPVETIYGSLINGPWDMTAADDDHSAVLFVTNVLNGTVAAGGTIVNQGTVVRLNLAVSEKYIPFLVSMTVIGDGFSERTDSAALVIGPTGVALSPDCRHSQDPDDCFTPFGEDEPVLYVADSLNNRIAVITDPFTRTVPAGNGETLTSGWHLNDPLGLTVAPNGHIISVNGDDGYAVETTPHGQQIAIRLLDSSGSPPGNGALFGVVYDPSVGDLVYVDDATNTLNKLQ
jgi:hypothetical protein